MNHDEWLRFLKSDALNARARRRFRRAGLNNQAQNQTWYNQAHQESVKAIRYAFQNDAGGLAMCGTQRPGGSGVVPFVCTRLRAHSGPHMALTLLGQTQAIWADAAATTFEDVACKIIYSPRLGISNGSLVVGREW